MNKTYGPTLPISEEKRCFSCTNTKSILDFHKGADRCKDCAKVYAKEYREKNPEKAKAASKTAYKKNQEKHKKRVEVRRLERDYGLSQEDYHAMITKQNNRCAICDKAGGFGLEKLVIDHCHKSGKVRGLLCRLCNTSLGGFRDDEELLMNAVYYLRRTK